MVDIIEGYKKGLDKVTFNQVEKYNIKKQKNKKEYIFPSFLDSTEAVKQYTNEYLYQAEVAFRKWMKKKCEDEKWCRSYMSKRYTYSMLIEEIFGRPYDKNIDNSFVASRMFAYYCSQVKKCFYDWKTGKTKTKTCYCLSVAEFKNKKPFCLRLQEEYVLKEGKIPSKRNVFLRKALKPGQAKLPETRKSIERRKEKANERKKRNNQSKQ